MKRAQSSVFHFRQRIPRDVLPKAHGLKLTIPVGARVVEKSIGPKTAELSFSLHTREPQEAKARKAAIIAHLDGVWRRLRAGVKSLSKREAVALSQVGYTPSLRRGASAAPLKAFQGHCSSWSDGLSFCSC